MTQEEYTLYTGESINYSASDWASLVEIAEIRLASFLCLDSFPELDSSNKDLAYLLANFICATLKYQGNFEDAEEKRIRNFTIRFREGAANAFAQIFNQFHDVIEKYSECGDGLDVERTWRCCCERGWYNGL